MEPPRQADSHWHEEVDHRFAGLERGGRALLYTVLAAALNSRKSKENPVLAPSQALDWAKIRRVLLIKEPYRMGDLFQITPLLRALKTRHPQISLGLVVQDRNLPVFRDNPHVSRIHLYEKKSVNRNPFLALGFISEIRRERYDLAVTLETERVHLTNDLIALASGAPLRLRYDSTEWDGGVSNAFYNLVVQPDRASRHQVERNFGVFTPFGLTLENRSLELRISSADAESAMRWLERAGFRPEEKFVAMHPGAYKLLNRWPIEKYIALAEMFRAAGRKVVFTLGPSEDDWEERVRSSGIPAVNRAPLGVVAALLAKSGLVVCNDTGILHVAGGLGVPTIGLFAQTAPEQWKPPGKQVLAIRASDRSMASITVQEVWEAASSAGIAGKNFSVSA